jgi:hypothetical protein
MKKQGCSRSFAHHPIAQHISREDRRFSLQSERTKSTSILQERSGVETRTPSDFNARFLPFYRLSSDNLFKKGVKNSSYESVASVDIVFLESEKEYSLPTSPFPAIGSKNPGGMSRFNNFPIQETNHKKNSNRKMTSTNKQRVKMFYIGTSDESNDDSDSSSSSIENKPSSIKRKQQVSTRTAK